MKKILTILMLSLLTNVYSQENLIEKKQIWDSNMEFVSNQLSEIHFDGNQIRIKTKNSGARFLRYNDKDSKGKDTPILLEYNKEYTSTNSLYLVNRTLWIFFVKKGNGWLIESGAKSYKYNERKTEKKLYQSYVEFKNNQQKKLSKEEYDNIFPDN